MVLGLAAVLVAGVVTLPTFSAPAPVPRRGGELPFVVAAEPPSFDGHRENTYAMIHVTAPHYSTLLKFDPFNYPKVVGDLAESWDISRDGLTYSFKLRAGVKWHDGSPLTSKDVKATYDKIIFPPAGVVSLRKAAYAAVDRVETPDERTVVFRLKHSSGSLVANLASPWNFVYKADILARDPRWFEKNIMGSGPFKFVEYVRGSHWIGKRNEDYYIRGQPYLDSFRAIFIREPAAQVAAVRGGRALIEFRSFSPEARDTLVKELGDRIRVQEKPWVCVLTLSFNNERRPFSDVKFRKALNIAFDRWTASRVLSRITFIKGVGGLTRPGSEWAQPDDRLKRMGGFGTDMDVARRDARRLLREAGVPEGFKFVLKNRDTRMPYEPLGVYLIDQWRRVGLNVEHQAQETGPYFNDFRVGNYDAGIDFNCDFMDDPDLQLIKFVSSDKSPINYGRYRDSTLDELYERQSRTVNFAQRRDIVWQFEKRVIDEMAYQLPTLWWHRIIPHHSRVKGWEITPSHYVNQDLSTVWLE
ncbi:MAG: ABC transporter substrate-binding protein [Armatimonadetes bacterium]|nr:ABC transporter substrate-binding protein [Armatimonadota bacterium]